VPDRNQLIAECASLLEEGIDHEGLIAFLREQGCSKIDSIVALSAALRLDLGRAKELVHCSEAWRDMRESDNQLHEEFAQALSELVRKFNEKSESV
jgi:hypothetical protein